MHVEEKVVSQVIKSGNSFKNGVIPDTMIIHEGNKPYPIWETLKNSVYDIVQKQGVSSVSKLSLPSQKGRVTRRGTRIRTDESAYHTLFDSKLVDYGNYLHKLSEQMLSRFKPWPQWLILCDEAFNFESVISNEKRKTSFDKLMECPSGPNPLLKDEKDRLKSEFTSCLLNAKRASDSLKIANPNQTQSDLWYKLTEEIYYRVSQKKVMVFEIGIIQYYLHF